MSELLKMTVANLPSFLQGVANAPKVQLRYMRSEMSRGLKRMRKSFIRTQLHGSPGINASGRLSKGKNVFTYVNGDSMKTLGGKIGISRVLHVHEKGLTIRAKRPGGMLAIHEKGANSPVVAMVPQVTIPKRLHFESQVKGEAPAVLVKVAEAGYRATEKTMKDALKAGIKAAL